MGATSERGKHARMRCALWNAVRVNDEAFNGLVFNVSLNLTRFDTFLH